MKVTRLTKKMLKRRRSRPRFRLRSLINLLRDKVNSASNHAAYLDDLCRNLRRKLDEIDREDRSGHWILIIEHDQQQHRILHFEGGDARRLAKTAYNNNVQPKRVTTLAKVLVVSGDYADVGKAILGGETSTTQMNRMIGDSPTPLIELP